MSSRHERFHLGEGTVDFQLPYGPTGQIWKVHKE